MSKLRVVPLLRQLKAEIKEQVAGCPKKPVLMVVLVGLDPASFIYVKNIQKKAKQLGIECQIKSFSDSVTQKDLEKSLQALADDATVDGVMVQRPLPEGLDLRALLKILPADKDVEGVVDENLGKIISGDNAASPCTAKAVFELIQSHNLLQFGTRVVIMGISTLVGKPLLNWLSYHGGVQVTMIDINTPDPKSYTRQADLLVVAIGCPQEVRSDYIKPGAVVIDVGINQIKVDGQEVVVGDVDFDDCKSVASAISVVPGGVGRITTFCIFKNLLFLCRQKKSAQTGN